jgi:hypothetical protein
MATVRHAESREAWRRFTLLDLFLFQAAFGIGLSLAFSTDRAWEHLLFALSLSSVLGCLLAGPIVLGSQCLLRGRRQKFSGGEWLWLSPLLLLLILSLFSVVVYLFFNFLSLFLVFVATLASVFSVALAIGLLLSRAERDSDQMPCYWTDRFGTFAALYIHLSCWAWIISQVSVTG